MSIPTATPIRLVTASKRRGLFRRLLRDPVAVVCMAFIVFVALVAVFAPLLTSQSPTASTIANSLAQAPAMP